ATPTQSAFFAKNNIDPTKVFSAKRCKHCSDMGYRGRIGIFDVLEMDDALRASIANGTLSVTELKKDIEKRGLATLKKEGIKKVLAGITTLDEIKRVTSDMGV
ncbi:MAG: hypothetical protein Q7T18_02420, partial [Sedimentisphaerales bacterium]|nr:hypothetical protein [Sedimentisphaerales bacterium]